jgi:hypothetical protein
VDTARYWAVSERASPHPVTRGQASVVRPPGQCRSGGSLHPSRRGSPHGVGSRGYRVAPGGVLPVSASSPERVEGILNSPLSQQRPALRCSLTTCRDLSGESPDDGRFPVRPSSLTPSTARRRPVPKAGVTRYLRRRGSTPRRSQPGGPGKRTGRSMTRTMQPRKGPPSGIAGRDGDVGGDSLVIRGSLVSLSPGLTGGASGPTGVRSAARGDSTPGKVGKVSRVA